MNKNTTLFQPTWSADLPDQSEPLLLTTEEGAQCNVDCACPDRPRTMVLPTAAGTLYQRAVDTLVCGLPGGTSGAA
jgi:hypothetical protein